MKTPVQTALLSVMFFSVLCFPQRAITSADYNTWLTGKVDFIMFDVRGDAIVDSILSPCFYVPSAKAIQWADSIGCRKRLLVVCHAGVLAAQTADSIVSHGYPADSVFSTGFDLITAPHFPFADTLPLFWLGTGGSIPVSPTAYQLRVITFSKRPCRLIDVRSATEVASGLIPGACNIAWPSPFQTASASFDKNIPIVLYCASGNRAGQARQYLISAGFNAALVDSFGGFSKWSGAPGLPSTLIPSATCECTGVEKKETALSGPELISCSPNPFTSSTRLFFNLPEGSSGFVDILDVKGRRILRQLITAALIRGGLVLQTGSLPAGVYLLRVKSGSRSFSKRLIRGG